MPVINRPTLDTRSYTAVVSVWLAASVAATVALGTISCSGKHKSDRDLVVTSYSPKQAGDGTPIQIQFDRPVVGASEVGAPLATPPVTIEPAATVEAHWLDRQTLVVTPKSELAPSSTYKLTLTGELARRTGGFDFSFVNQPLAIEGIWGVDLTRLPSQPSLPVHFNQEVTIADAVAHCRIESGAAAEPITLESDEAASDAAASITLTPTKPLAQGATFTFVCDQLAGAGGDTPLAQPYVVELRTYPGLTVTGLAPDGWDVPADEVDFEIRFSNPVDLATVRKQISLKPAAPGFDNGWLDRTGTKYRVTVNLQTETDYELVVSKALTDAYGQQMTYARSHSFRTGDAQPRLVLETGIYAVETAAPGYPVWTRNVKAFDIECAAVPKSKVVPLLTSNMDYDPWYDAADPDVDWNKLGLAVKSEKIAIAQPKNKWHLSNLPLEKTCGGKQKRGLYLASMASDDVTIDEDNPWRYHPNRRVLANVTDLGILTKAGTASGLVWVSQLSTGKPVKGAAVSIYSPQGKKVYSGKTDKHGILRTPGSTELLSQPGAKDKDDFEDDPEEDFWSYRSQRLIVVAEFKGDMGVVDGNWANGIQTWNFGVPEDRKSGKTRIRGFIQSDRGIYRPGEKVYFKGLAREIHVGKDPVVPSSKTATITVEDSRGSTIYDKKLKLSRFGGFHFELELPAEASLGDYQVRATINKQTFRERFQVEEFRKVAYEVKLAGGERHARLGDKFSFALAADYLFGAPVVAADVEWSLQRRQHRISFAKFRQYSFADWAARGDYYWGGYYGYDYPSYIADGNGTTDKHGKVTIDVRDPQTNFTGPQDYIVNARVTDDTDQTISKSAVITAHKTDFYLGLHTQEYVQAVGMPFAVNVVALSPEGKRVATKVKLSLIRQDYQCTYNDAGYRAYQSCKSVHKLAQSHEVEVGKTGTTTQRIMPKQPGEYIVRVEATDGRGNPVAASDYVWILGKGEAFWSGDESARMTLISSKPEYKPGETAKLVPRTNLENAHALVTLERNGILDAFTVAIPNASSGIEIPLKDLHAPNVYASVAMVSGRSGPGDKHRPQFKMGVVDLKVSPDKQRLEVEISTDKDKYEPGQKVTGTIKVTAGGKPVRAELSLSVADEGVLQLIDYKTPDPMKTFYASWGMGIDNSTNWNRIARLNDPSVIDPDEGGDDGGDEEQQVRSRFVSSAYWKPAIVTDADGMASFSFDAPDNLTAFRLMAVGGDAGSRFGSSDKRITIAKPLLAKPVLPRFLTAGDKAEVGVVVHNYTGAAGTATVTAKATGASFTGSKTRTVRLAKDGTARVRFAVTAADRTEARFTFAVKMASYRDALALSVPIGRGLTRETVTVARGHIKPDGGPVTTPVSWRSSSVADASTLSISVDRTGLSDLEPSLRYLIEYPYGCLEQTLSRFVPLTKVKDLAGSLGMASLQGPKMKKFIQIGAAKVVRHQHADGHYSLWPSGPTYPHLTVYATYGLLEARRAGVTVDEDAIDSGVAAIRRWANASDRDLAPGGETGTMAMAAYLLAETGKPDHALEARLFAARKALPRYGQAFLLRAMVRSKRSGKDVMTLKDELVAATEKAGAGLVVRETMDLDYYMSTDARSTALVLSALLEADPNSAAIEPLVEGLKSERASSGRWRSTQDNLYSLVALADYARRKAAGSSTVTIRMGGKKVTRKITGGEVFTLRKTLDGLQPGDLRISSAGELRYTVVLSEARRDPAKTAIDRGFQVQREYVDPDTGMALTRFKAGQLIKVRVRVTTPKDRNFVAVIDPLPAGLEAVNTRLATSQQAPSRYSGYGYRHRSYYSYGWTHTELRDDQVQGFADRMRAGQLTMEYLARATIPGSFRALPATAEEMYNPATNGASPALTVEVVK